MKTSNYFTYSGHGRISVSRSVPRFTAPGYKIFRALAPGKWLYERQYKYDQQAYRERYFSEILAPLDSQATYDALCALAAPYEPVLLCWEDLTKPDEWCHRRMIAEWFEDALGIHVPEVVPVPATRERQLEIMDGL
jgi:hypothetical protein